MTSKYCFPIMMIQSWTLSALLLLIVDQLNALRLPTFIADHMVLQRAPAHSRLWGWADNKGATIHVQLNGVVEIGRTTVATAVSRNSSSTSGYYWQVDLIPQPASVDVELVITEDGDNTNTTTSITLHDIAFGDVFLCSGQSNMEMSVSGVFNAQEEIQDSSRYPHLRMATVAERIANSTQADVDAKTKDQTWWRSGVEAFSGGTFQYFSAACYFAGRDVYKALDGLVPIGLVTSCWGGQTVETFSSPDALADETCGGTIRQEHHRRASIRTVQSTKQPFTPLNTSPSGEEGPQATQLWYGMITPLLPMRFSGVLWYQGESNAHDPSSYACRFPAMITDWRKKLEISELPFFFVQLAAIPDRDYSLIRAAQDAALDLEHVSVALAIDIGDPTSPWQPVHPRRKQEVGRRLALDILHGIYKMGRGSQGPEVTGVQLDGSIDGIVLEMSKTERPVLYGTAACSECCYIVPFETLDASTGNWTRVTASPRIGDNEIVLNVPTSNVVGIRYNWEAYPQCAVYDMSRKELPMAPFEWCKYGGELPPWTGSACDLGPSLSSFISQFSGSLDEARSAEIGVS